MVITKDCIEYLRVTMDKTMTFEKHVGKVVPKAKNVATALIRILPRNSNTKEDKAHLLNLATPSMHLIYKLKYSRFANTRLGYTVSKESWPGGYRIISTDSVMILARIVLIRFLVEESRMLLSSPNKLRTEARKKTNKMAELV